MFVKENPDRKKKKDLIFEDKRQKTLEKNQVVNLLELRRVKKAVMQSMKPAEYKHLLLSLKKKIKKIRKTIKQEIGESNKILEESNKKLEE